MNYSAADTAALAQPSASATALFRQLDISLSPHLGDGLNLRSPIDGSSLVALRPAAVTDVDGAIARAQAAFREWRVVPAPARGDLVRRFNDLVRANQRALSALVTLECGKTVAEAQGEIQEVIDICDFAVGLSRQLYGAGIATERPGHRMAENWHPLGVLAQITAFNFPAAVWSWGAIIAIVCGNAAIWKPSEKAPLTALALNGLLEKAIAEHEQAPAGLSQVLLGGGDIGSALVADPRVPVISATGSTEMGKKVARAAAEKLARTVLELGGNNAAIITPNADLDLALRAAVFSAVGTTGQRCTTLRRLIVHRSLAADFTARLKDAYGQLRIGDPRERGVHLGPLIDKAAYDGMQAALARAGEEGGAVWGGARVLEKEFPDAWYVAPAIVSMPGQSEIVRTETFAPILYVMEYDTLEEAIALHNDVPQGLSSAIFTTDIREAETFMSALGSDCGIANVNIGTSGAEVGGAFGGEKMTGGGRAAGSDTWKNYMRRATNTINYSTELPLAQGIKFGG